MTNAPKTPEKIPSKCEPVGATAGNGSEHYAVYSDYSKLLRTWLVAYGIGWPVLILSQSEIWKKLARTGSMRGIAILFLAGVFLQVALAAINKSVMWVCYYGDTDLKFKVSRRYRISCWLSEQYLIDLTCDLLTIALFGIATYICFLSLIP